LGGVLLFFSGRVLFVCRGKPAAFLSLYPSAGRFRFFGIRSRFAARLLFLDIRSGTVAVIPVFRASVPVLPHRFPFFVFASGTQSRSRFFNTNSGAHPAPIPVLHHPFRGMPYRFRF